MSKKTTKLVPNLRFPEFRDAGTWQQLRLDEIASRVSLKNKNGQAIRVLTNSAADGIVDQRDYFEKDIAVQGNLEGYYVVNNGDYVYNPRVSNLAPVGPISKNKLGTGVMSPLYSVFRFKDSDNNFYEQYFKTPNWHLYLRKISNSGARHDRMAISTEDFMSLPLPAPSPKEQKKIADCLSSIDELITAQAQKVEALKTHKKGLMQQLFPREGETVPRLRFPEFRDAGEWQILPFKEIAKFLSGGTPSKDVSEYWGGSIPWISASSMHTTKIDRSDSNITEFAVSDGARIAKKGTLLLLVRGSMLHKRIPIGITETDVSFNQDVKALELKGDITECYLMNYLIASESKLLAAVTSTGIGAGKLDTNDLNDFPIGFPSAKEQRKIADCLSSIDDLITAQSQKLEALKIHKKGLMQQLFPSSEADSE
jgi:type I restriction enzyme S subunit